MSDNAIEIRDLGKEYLIAGPETRADSFRDVLTGAVRAPFERLRRLRGVAAERERFWALRELSFDVPRGQVLGVIGRNGAGKSTLLKILSRITTPSEGSVRMRGRVGSLLEVGTGFHPELSGRENIYLNGAILGMTRQEIGRRFDEIVDYANVATFLDTPVKRYSSGMRVRLAFAVAAHLDPDILLVDEVLAVGDAAFQRKCINTLSEVGAQGRTVLFVSHQMDMVQALCGRCVLLEAGRLSMDGDPAEVIEAYSRALVGGAAPTHFEAALDPTLPAQILAGQLRGRSGTATATFDVHEPIELEMEYVVRVPREGMIVTLDVRRAASSVFLSFDTDTAEQRLSSREPGRYRCRVRLPNPLLKPGAYTVSVGVGIANGGAIQRIEDACAFEVEMLSRPSSFLSYAAKRPGYVAASLDWETDRIGDSDSGSGARV